MVKQDRVVGTKLPQVILPKKTRGHLLVGVTSEQKSGGRGSKILGVSTL
jgi:hypothetical protein